MERKLSKVAAFLLAAVLMVSLLPAVQTAAATTFELPVDRVSGDTLRQIAWGSDAYGGAGRIPGLTPSLIAEAGGYLNIESSAPLSPGGGNLGIVLSSNATNWSWAGSAMHTFSSVPGAAGSTTFRLPIHLHPDFDVVMADGTFTITFFAWDSPSPMPITRAFFDLGPPPEPEPPTIPRNFAALPGNGQVSLTWLAPLNDGGSEILRFEVSSNGGGTWVTASSATSHTFTGLNNDTEYNFRVRAVNAVGNSPEATATATPFDPMVGPPQYTDFIVIDQFGYRPDARKIAVIRNPILGEDAHLSFNPGSVYQVINEETGVAVFTGAPVHIFAHDVNSGDEIWHFDFSQVTQPGRYFILDVERNVRSFSFSIAVDVYNEVLRHAVRMFFYQRSGFAKEVPYADPRWADDAAFLHDEDSRFYLHPEREDLSRDLRGAWFDAGDYNKYTAWTADYVEALLEIYRRRPEVFGDNSGIPESGNGIPDILDEARWGMDWLLLMQNDNSVDFGALGVPGYPTNIACFDGSLLSIVGYGAAGASPPSLDTADTEPSRYGPPNTIATISGAKAFALGAIVFEQYDPDYAAILRAAALRAFDWAVANPNVYFSNNVAHNNSLGLAAGNQDPSPDGADNPAIRPRMAATMQAGLHLFELTGERRFLEPFEQNYRTLPLFQWYWMDMYRFENHRLYLHYLMLPPEDTNPAIRTNVMSQLRTAFHRADGNFAARTASCGYLAFMYYYPWGSLSIMSAKAWTFYYFAELGIVYGSHTAESHRNAAESYLHYIHGVNPFNMVFLTNMNDYGASRSTQNIYHAWFSPWYRQAGFYTPPAPLYGPPPGFLPGGPNSTFYIDGAFPGNIGGYGILPVDHPVHEDVMDVGNRLLAMQNDPNFPVGKRYIDTDHTWPINSWEITEPMGAYQVNYIRLLSKFAQPLPQVIPDDVTISAVGVTPPVPGQTPVTTVTATEQFTGTVTWQPAHSPFEYGTVYTATITLTPRAGFTLANVSANFFTVEGATATNPAGSGVITAVFPATGRGTQSAPSGTSATNETAPGANDGTITGVTTAMEFRRYPDTTYSPVTATTISNLAPGTFYVRYAATATHYASASTQVVVEAAQISNVDISAILGVTPPAPGQTPVTTVTATEQFTGTVTWYPAHSPFEYGTVYTATITLTPAAGFTLSNVAEDFFTVAGATATNPAGSGVITAVFPATGRGSQTAPSGISATNETAPGANDGTITGVTTAMEFRRYPETTYSPVAANPISNLAPGRFYVRYAATETHYASPSTPVVVAPAPEPGTQVLYFAQDQLQKILGVDTTFTQEVQGVRGTGAITFTSSDETVATVTNDGVVTIVGAGSTTITAEIAECAEYDAASASYTLVVELGTQSAPSGISATNETAPGANDGTITGVTTDMEIRRYPDTTYSPVTEIPMQNLAPGTFYVRYAATATHNASPSTQVVVEAAQISNVDISEILGVTPPVPGQTPVTTIIETAQFTGTVTWYPAHSTFAYGTVYTAIITLTPAVGFTLSNVAEDFFTVAGATVTNPAGSGVVTAVFPATGHGAQTAPSGLTATHETAPGANNGTITGVTTAMEFRRYPEAAFTPVAANPISNLAPGMYHVRFAATGQSYASDYVLIVIYENFVPGDADGDRRVTSADATRLARWLQAATPGATDTNEAQNAIIPRYRLQNMNLTGNGLPTLGDLTLLAQWLVGHNVTEQFSESVRNILFAP